MKDIVQMLENQVYFGDRVKPALYIMMWQGEALLQGLDVEVVTGQDKTRVVMDLEATLVEETVLVFPPLC